MHTPASQNPEQLWEEKAQFNLLEINGLVLLEKGSSGQDFYSAPTTTLFFLNIILNYLVLY